MHWTDTAILLSARRLGESGVVLGVLSREHGRHAGYARGGRRAAQWQPGAIVRVRWAARVAEQLGSLTVEPVSSPAGRLFDRPLPLLALASAAALLDTALPERAAFPGVYDATAALLDALEGPHWDAVYVEWERGLLGALGYGLDLSRCAVTGAEAGLAYVSPRTGRAVSAEAAAPFADRLLRLPGFLVGQGPAGPEEVLAGLALTGHFIDRFLAAQAHRPTPSARTRLVEACRRRAAAAAGGA